MIMTMNNCAVAAVTVAYQDGDWVAEKRSATLRAKRRGADGRGIGEGIVRDGSRGILPRITMRGEKDGGVVSPRTRGRSTGAIR